MNTGINNYHQKILKDILKKYLKQGSVILYGSRTNGKFNDRSDVDLVIKNSNLSNFDFINLIDEIDESNFPYLCDISLFENIQNNKLLKHINNFGINLNI